MSEWRRRSLGCVFSVVGAFSAAGALAAQAGAEAELREYVEQRAGVARRAWELKDPRGLIEADDSVTVLRRPDGSIVTAKDLRADLARRMAMVVRLDTLREELETLRPEGDSVEVTSRQRFVRLVKLPDGQERVRVSTVQHRQWVRRIDGRWRGIGPVQESDQVAYWADEGPP
jgi:hypothetical protein